LPKSRLETDVRWSSPITLASLTLRLREAGAGANDLQEVLESRDRELVAALCGPTYRPRADGPRRAGTSRRTFGTLLGRITVRVTLVRLPDGRIVTPLWQDVLISPRRLYQDDVVAAAISGVQRMSYRNTLEELHRLTGIAPSPRTLNRRVVEHGLELQRHLRTRRLQAHAGVPDGTRLRNQTKGHHELRITITENHRAPPQLRYIAVGERWDAHRDLLETKTRFVGATGESGPPRITLDGEPGLMENLSFRGVHHQDCHIHVSRLMTHAMWRDGHRKRTPESLAVRRQVTNLLRHLRNTVNAHANDPARIRLRIDETKRELTDLIADLREGGNHTTANSLTYMQDTLTVHAELAIKGYWMPWNTNRIERVMLEVSKRCKHRGMRWTTHGGTALVALLVYRFLEPNAYNQWWNTHLHGPTLKPRHGIDIQVTASGQT